MLSDEGAPKSKRKNTITDPRTASIEALKIVQKHRGWVEDGAVRHQRMCWASAAVMMWKVWRRSYSQIYRQPVGRHVIPLL